MSIKGGQILHVAGAGFIVDRISTGGITGINVNEERLEELGNYEAVGTVRDIPDLTYEIESYDVTTEFESVLTGGDNTEADGTLFNLANYVPLDILSPYKTSGLFTISGAVIIPFLNLESMSYNMTLGDPATMTATLRGDSAFFVPGSPYRQVFSGDGATTTFNFTNTALASAIGGDTYYALSVMVHDGTAWKRQRIGTDYTNTSGGITFTTAPPNAADNIAVVYGSATAATYSQAVHDTVKPAGVRGRDIEIQLGDGAGNYGDWLGVQSANVDWRITLERDEEFGNNQIVAQDFDVPEVTGTVTMKPRDVSALFEQVQEIAGIGSTAIANATADPPDLELLIALKDPDTGAVQKTLHVPDAKFVMPSVAGSVGQKLEVDFAFTSETGVLEIYKGEMASS